MAGQPQYPLKMAKTNKEALRLCESILVLNAMTLLSHKWFVKSCILGSGYPKGKVSSPLKPKDNKLHEHFFAQSLHM